MNNHGGYETDIIAQLASMLDDKYDFHSIMKELFQNADDADSKELHIAFVEHLPGNTHPLLQGPLFVILDDGKFTEENKIGISRIGAGSKSSDAASIGRFGLGMKSIHHLCEAYFYIASPNQPAAKGEYLPQLISPWFNPGIGDAIYTNWKVHDETYDFLINTIKKWQHRCDRWFALIIPLRTKEQIGKKLAPLCSHDNQYPDLNKIKNENSPDRLASLMPLMRNLKKIYLWNSLTDTAPNTTIKIQPSAATCRYPNKIYKGDAVSPIDVPIHISKSSNQLQIHNVIGNEAYLSNQIFDKLKAYSTWPTTSVFDKNNGRQTLPVPAEPHCAVTLKVNKKQSSKAKLMISYAVFLPLSETLINTNIDGEYDFQILLHGIFFLDSGRRHIYTKENQQSQVQYLWNENIITVDFQLFLYSLEDFAQKEIVNNEGIHILTQALKEHLTSDQQNLITQYGSWFYCLENDTCSGTWKRLEPQKEVFAIPNMKDSPNTMFEVFPMLKRVISNHNITYYDYAYISATPPAGCADNEEIFQVLFSILSDNIFVNAKELEYFLLFLKHIGNLSIEQGKYILHKLFPLLNKLSEKDEKRIQEKLAQLFGLLPEKLLVTLNETISSNAIQNLNKHIINTNFTIDKFFISERLSPNHCNQLEMFECITLFKELIHSNTLSNEDKSSIAIALIDKCQGTFEEKFKALGNFRVFWIKEFLSEKGKICTWIELANLHDQGQLFGNKGGSSFITLLNKALKSIKFYRINQNDSPFRILFNKDQIPTSNKISCYETLQTLPELSHEIKYRLDLFSKLLHCPSDYDQKNYQESMRYLIHCNKEKFKNIEVPMLVQQNIQQEGISLNRLTEEALNRLKDDWLWVPKEFADIINEKDKNDLNISNIMNSILEGLLKDTGTDWLLDFKMTEKERVELLKNIKDDKLWMELPLHKTTHNKNTTLIKDDISIFFLDSKNSIKKSDILKKYFCFIQPPKDDILLLGYKKVLKVATPDNLLKEILINKNVSLFLKDILEAFAAMAKDRINIDDELKNIAREIEWLPTFYGIKKCNCIIDIPEAENEIKTVVECYKEPQYVSISHITNDVANSKGFKYIRENLFKRDKEGLILLLKLCNDLPQYGLCSFDFNQNKINMMLDIFEDINPSDYPALHLLKQLHRKKSFSYSDLQYTFLPSINHIPTLKINKQILLHLYKKHKQINNGVKKNDLLNLFKEYLKDLLKNDKFTPETLRNLYFLNKDKIWVKASCLGLNAKEISNAYLIENNLKDILLQNDLMSGICSKQITYKEKSLTSNNDNKKLYQYFWSLAKKIDKSLVGGFLALLGNNNKEFTKIASDLLSPHSIESFRTKINWTEIKRKNYEDSGSTKTFCILAPNEKLQNNTRDTTINYLMNCHNFDILLKEGKTVTILNLCGEKFEADIKSEYYSLIVGDIKCKVLQEKENWNHYYNFSLRKVDIEDTNTEILSSQIKKSILVILRDVYDQKTPNINELLKEIQKTEQLQIDVVQNIILENGLFYLKQLGEIPSLKDIVKKFDEYKYLKAEHIRNSIKMREAENLYKECIEMLKERIKDKESPFLEETLSVIQNKIQQYQYDISSIPFELFQNADDAYSEREKMHEEILSCNFTIEIKGDIISFIHSGRPINCFQNYSTGFMAEDGKNLNFHTDLEKMLVFSYSNKDSNDTSTTGKFGLGFKSVYLLSDSPKVISSKNIAFKILGGFYPERLSNIEKNKILKISSKYGEPEDLTIIYLESDHEKINTTMSIFLIQIPLLLIFAKKITEFKLNKNESTLFIKKNATLVRNTNTIFSGKLQHSVIDSNLNDQNFILFQKDTSSMLLALDVNKGVVSLPDNIYNIWATTPLKGEDCGFGLALNGDFNIDVGRSCLAANQDGKFDDTARDLYNSFKELIQCSHNWEEFHDEFNLRVSKYDFFNSIFNLFIKLQQATPLHKIIWNRNFYPHLLNNQILPNGLQGNYKSLTSTKQIKYVVTGILAKESSIFESILANSTFNKSYNAKELISETNFKKIPSQICKTINVNKVSLCNILELIISQDKHISPEDIFTLALLFSSPNIKTLKKEAYISEYHYIRELLRNILLKSQSGMFKSLTSLVIPEKHEILATFAPDEALLSDEYNNEDAMSFIYFCLGEADINTKLEEIIIWGINASDDDSKKGFIRYILSKSDNSLKGILSRKVSGSWLESLDYESELLSDLPPNEKLEILSRINSQHFIDKIENLFQLRTEEIEGIDNFQNNEEISEDNIDIVDISDEEADIRVNQIPNEEVKNILNGIYDWWTYNQEIYTKRYEVDIYFTETFFKISNTIPESKNEKIAWMNFILLGILHKIGRTSLQAHRNFIQESNKNSWINSFIEDNSWNSFSCFDSYLNKSINNIKYHQWIYRMFDLKIISLKLDETVEVILNAGHNQFDNHASLEDIFNTKSSLHYQGGGIYTYPLLPILGIGVHFILREMTRNQIIDNSAIYQYCYLPVLKVRRIFEAMGCEFTSKNNSQTIYNFLSEKMGEDKATFNYSFDIPFLMIANNEKLQEHFRLK